jgi:chromosome segregation ATPase
MKSQIAFVVLLTTACTSKDQLTRIKSENDSLRKELATSQEMLFTFKEVGSLIDSIDQSRNALRVNIVEGTPYFSYTERLQEINSYIKSSEKKISNLESTLKEYSNQSEAYEMLVAALKDELTIAIEDMRRMEDRVSKAVKDNKDVNQIVKLQRTNLEDFQLQLDAKYEEVKLFEVRIQELTSKLQITEADAMFAQAQALELAAKRTRLAPRKKRETYNQALDLYTKALQAGHPQAQVKINDLKKRV